MTKGRVSMRRMFMGWGGTRRGGVGRGEWLYGIECPTANKEYPMSKDVRLRR